MATTDEQVQEYLNARVAEIAANADARVRAMEEHTQQVLAQAAHQTRLLEEAAASRRTTNNQGNGNQVRPPKPEKFSGETRKALAWTFEMENYLRSTHMSGEDGVNFAAAFFQGPVLIWWQVRMSNPPPLTEWSALRDELLQRFGERNSKKHAFHKLMEIRQLISAREYSHRFHTLLLQMPDVPMEQQVMMYIRGLKKHVKLHVDMQAPKTLDEACDLADKVDTDVFYNERSRTNYRSYGAGGATPMELGSMETHRTTSRSPTPPPRSGPSRDSRTCFKCGKPGHIIRNCPSNKGGEKKVRFTTSPNYRAR